MRTFAAVLLIALGACGQDGPPASRPGGGVNFAADRAARADWTRAPTVEVALDEYAFTPETIRLAAGEPVKLVIRNKGRSRHSFAAPDLMRASAVQGVVPGPGETLPTVSYNEINVSPGAYKELHILPIEKGVYDLKCSVIGHSLFGMTGRVVVE